MREIAGVSWGKARDLCATGRVRLDGVVETDGALRIPDDANVEVNPSGPKLHKGVLAPEAIVFADRDVVVVRKPAGLMTVPFDGERDTLVDQTRAALRRRALRGGREAAGDPAREGGRVMDADADYDPMLGVVQRLDKDTSGILVFARTMAAKKHLEGQLRSHTVLRRYLAIAHFDVKDAEIESLIVPDRGDGLRGSWGVWRRARGEPPEEAQRSITHVRRLEGLRGATLVECRLETGRQHQIRIHLSEAGHPLVGEHVYVRELDRAKKIEAPRPMLHATELGFDHPRTGEAVRWEDPPPRDFADMLRRLRG